MPLVNNNSWGFHIIMLRVARYPNRFPKKVQDNTSGMKDFRVMLHMSNLFPNFFSKWNDRQIINFSWVIYVHKGGPIIISVSRTNHILPSRFDKNIWKRVLWYQAFFKILISAMDVINLIYYFNHQLDYDTCYSEIFSGPIWFFQLIKDQQFRNSISRPLHNSCYCELKFKY